VASDEVIQIYVKNKDSVFAPPNPILCAFEKVHFAAGEKKELTLRIPQRAFQIVDEEGVRRQDGTNFRFYAGISQPDARSAELTGKKCAEFTWNLK
jgi:beta-glucosidase